MTYTVGEVAAELRVSTWSVKSWISSGQLRAFSASAQPGSRKPRWRIAGDDLAAFRLSRSNMPPTPARKKPNLDNVIKFFA